MHYAHRFDQLVHICVSIAYHIQLLPVTTTGARGGEKAALNVPHLVVTLKLNITSFEVHLPYSEGFGVAKDHRLSKSLRFEL